MLTTIQPPTDTTDYLKIIKNRLQFLSQYAVSKAQFNQELFSHIQRITKQLDGDVQVSSTGHITLVF